MYDSECMCEMAAFWRWEHYCCWIRYIYMRQDVPVMEDERGRLPLSLLLFQMQQGSEFSVGNKFEGIDSKVSARKRAEEVGKTGSSKRDVVYIHMFFPKDEHENSNPTTPQYSQPQPRKPSYRPAPPRSCSAEPTCCSSTASPY